MKLKTKVLSALAVLIFAVSQSVAVPSADQPIISSKDTAQVYSEIAQLSELDFSGGEIIVTTINEKMMSRNEYIMTFHYLKTCRIIFSISVMKKGSNIKSQWP